MRHFKGEGAGGLNPLLNIHKNIRFLSNTGRDPLELLKLPTDARIQC